MEMKTEYKFDISKKFYRKLKKVECISSYSKDFYSTKQVNSILFLEPNTLQTFEITNPQIVEAIGSHRKVSLTLEMNQNEDLTFYYLLTLVLK